LDRNDGWGDLNGDDGWGLNIESKKESVSMNVSSK
jgi:hypothetical protein